MFKCSSFILLIPSGYTNKYKTHVEKIDLDMRTDTGLCHNVKLFSVNGYLVWVALRYEISDKLTENGISGYFKRLILLATVDLPSL